MKILIFTDHVIDPSKMMHQNEQLEARLEHGRLSMKYEYFFPPYKERCFNDDEMAYLSELLSYGE